MEMSSGAAAAGKTDQGRFNIQLNANDLTRFGQGSYR